MIVSLSIHISVQYKQSFGWMDYSFAAHCEDNLSLMALILPFVILLCATYSKFSTSRLTSLFVNVLSCTTQAFVVSPIQMLPGLVCNSVPLAHLLPIWRCLRCKCACSAFCPSMITRKDILLVIDQECNVSAILRGGTSQKWEKSLLYFSCLFHFSESGCKYTQFWIWAPCGVTKAAHYWLMATLWLSTSEHVEGTTRKQQEAKIKRFCARLQTEG